MEHMLKKVCFRCNKLKSISEFYKHKQMPDGTVNKCKDCNKLENRENYTKNASLKRQYDSYRHRYSVIRIFNHRYSGIKHRCLYGRSNGDKYFVTGMDFLKKDEWLQWCYEDKNYKKFIEIYNNWVQSDFDRKLSPSIDRVDNNKGYIASNLQWLSKSDNSKKFNK